MTIYESVVEIWELYLTMNKKIDAMNLLTWNIHVTTKLVNEDRHWDNKKPQCQSDLWYKDFVFISFCTFLWLRVHMFIWYVPCNMFHTQNGTRWWLYSETRNLQLKHIENIIDYSRFFKYKTKMDSWVRKGAICSDKINSFVHINRNFHWLIVYRLCLEELWWWCLLSLCRMCLRDGSIFGDFFSLHKMLSPKPTSYKITYLTFNYVLITCITIVWKILNVEHKAIGIQY